jgi:hypothetical protein
MMKGCDPVPSDDAIRELLGSALSADGRSGSAALAEDSAASVMIPYSELPGGARVFRVEVIRAPNASFYAGVAGQRVFYLTDSPEAFGAMLRAAGLRVTAPDVAVAAAVLYVETTRSMREFSGLVASVDDITWSPRATDQDVARVVRRLRSVIRLPEAVRGGQDHDVTLYAIRGATLERRRLHITQDGDVREEVEPVQDGLPVPFSM